MQFRQALTDNIRRCSNSEKPSGSCTIHTKRMNYSKQEWNCSWSIVTHASAFSRMIHMHVCFHRTIKRGLPWQLFLYYKYESIGAWIWEDRWYIAHSLLLCMDHANKDCQIQHGCNQNQPRGHHDWCCPVCVDEVYVHIMQMIIN